jgi:PiT family inorganic phosphate transporter
MPLAYALNRALPDSAVVEFQQTSQAAASVVEAKAEGYNVLGNPRPAVTAYIAQHQLNDGTYPSLAALMRDIAKQIADSGAVTKVPAPAVGNIRNDMYLTSEAIRFLMKDKESNLSKDDIGELNAYKSSQNCRGPARQAAGLDPCGRARAREHCSGGMSQTRVPPGIHRQHHSTLVPPL